MGTALAVGAGRSALIVVDPQKAFVDSRGSLIRAHGHAEVQPGVRALERLREALRVARGRGMPVVLLRSEYRPGQFTDGDVDAPMGRVCVPDANADCEWAEGLGVVASDTIITKHSEDGCEASAYRDCLDALVAQGLQVAFLAGFQLTTCVRATALSTARRLAPAGVRTVVLTAATGARASSYVEDAGAPSRAERTCRELARAGVDIARSMDALRE